LFGPVFYVALSVAADHLVITRAEPSLRYFDLFRGRCATSLLATIGHALGGGLYGVWLARKTGHPKLAIGTVIYFGWSDLTALAAIAALATLFSDLETPRSVWIAATSIAVALPLAIFFAPKEMLAPLQYVPKTTAFLQLTVRMLALSFLIVLTWTATRVFGLEIPFGAAATRLPVTLLIGALPVNVGGFGAVQGAWLVAFGAFASGPAILAFQLLWQLLIVVAMIVRALPFLKHVTREIESGRPRGG
jgi:hypothetical protein